MKRASLRHGAPVLATFSVGLALSIGLSSCGDDDGDGGDGNTSASLSAVTYNAGLARGFVPYSEERSAQTIEAIAGIDADIVCLQEVWDDDFVTDVKARSAAAYPTQLTIAPSQETTGEAACQDQAAIDAVETCAQANCADPPDAGCIGSCPNEFAALTPECQSCASSQLGQTLANIVSTCTSASAKYTFGGSFGLMLLAKGNVVETDELVMESNTIRRGVIYARVETDVGVTNAFCTHLTADLSSVPFPGSGSWEQENADQIATMLAWVDEKTAGADAELLMGDFNTGPAVGANVAELPANYTLLTSTGFSTDYGGTTPCTFCGDNPLVASGADSSPSVVIDHILLRSASPLTVAPSRILDQPITIDTADAGSIESALSDHYGVQHVLTR